MEQKRFYNPNFSLFIVKFKKSGFSFLCQPNNFIARSTLMHTLTEAKLNKGPSIKDVRSQERGGFVHFGHFTDKGEGVLQMRTPALFLLKKLRIFRNL